KDSGSAIAGQGFLCECCPFSPVRTVTYNLNECPGKCKLGKTYMTDKHKADFCRRRDKFEQLLEQREWGPGNKVLAHAVLMATDLDRSILQRVRDRIQPSTLDDDSLLLEALLKLIYYSQSVRYYGPMARFGYENKGAVDERLKSAVEFDAVLAKLELHVVQPG